MPENNATVRSWISQFAMQPHPEGGYFAEVYRSRTSLPQSALVDHCGSRPCLTSIYFLLLPGQISRFHRLRSDEIWYYHAGGSLTIHCIDEEGACRKLLLGPDFSRGQSFQAIVPAGTWFGATLNGDEASLVGCAVAPGFDFADFELAERRAMLARFPGQRQIIEALTKDN